MAAAVEANWSGELSGLVVTRYGHGVACKRIKIVEASHPVPDAAGLSASADILRLVRELDADDLVICLISGGGSALLTLPAGCVTLEDKQALTKDLLECGATISEINCVRKHLSAIKGGRLALAAAPARVVSLVMSDVPGDNLSDIASGPTVPDPTTRETALAVLKKYGLRIPASVQKHLENPLCETPKPGNPGFAGVQHVMIATPQMALEAAADVARAAGINPVILGDGMEGEARDVALVHAAIARHCARHAQPAPAPCVLISGGETTVTIRGEGRGGRNTEFLLALAIALDGHPNIWAIAGDTDGIDGSEDNAGALLTPDTLARAAAVSLSARTYLERNDAYTFFEELGDLVVTGPTRTNVNDFRAIAVMDAGNWK